MWSYTLLFGLQMITIAPPVSGQRSVTAKLHHPVTLTCDWKCSDLLKWTQFQNPGYILAQCDQSSCRSEVGFNISHDEYLKGKPYLTITAADYSNRGTYTCQCDHSDVCDVRLIIEQPCPQQEGGVPTWAIVLIVLLSLLGVALGVALVVVSVMYLRTKRGTEEGGPEQIPMTGTVQPDPGEEQG